MTLPNRRRGEIQRAGCGLATVLAMVVTATPAQTQDKLQIVTTLPTRLLRISLKCVGSGRDWGLSVPLSADA